LEQLRVAVAYEREGERVAHFPAEFGVESLAQWQPVYEELPGWDEDITALRRRGDLPPEAKAYVARIEQHLGVPITFIGVGPEREQAIF
jgi:adenylosuccinate synthase